MDYLEILRKQDYKPIRQLFESKKPKFGDDLDKENAITRKKQSQDYQAQCINEFKVENHDIFDENIRADKKITKDIGGDDGTGKSNTQETSVAVARIGVPFQELIVSRRVGFMLTTPVSIDRIYSTETENKQEKTVADMIDRIQNDNKMDYKNKEIARRFMSELECAELWYFVENTNINFFKKLFGVKGKYTLKVKIVSPDLGDKLFPLFDNTGDMVAFGRSYKLKEVEEKETEHFDVYTADFEYNYIETKEGWVLDPNTGKANPVPNTVKKLMVIYHSQPRPEWSKVQSMITRYENSSSNHADMNDYFGSPILLVKGTVKGFAGKGEEGKILELENESEASYLSWDASPESVKNEKENLEKQIYSMSQTPNITFDSMKGLGNLSGIAIKLMFLDAHMAVSNKEEIFGIGLQRRLNLIKACIGAIIDTSLKAASDSLQLKPVITPFLPTNETEVIDNLSVSVTAGILSKETAVEKNPLVEDSETEMTRLQNDATAELAQQPNPVDQNLNPNQ
jgi:SPP1 family phage portal protein